MEDLKELGASVLRAALALNEKLAVPPEPAAPTVVEVRPPNRIGFDADQGTPAPAVEKIEAGRMLTPGLVMNFEHGTGVVASCGPERLVVPGGVARDGLLVTVAEAGTTRWLTIEVLIDAASVKALGLIALLMRTSCRPPVRMHTLFRVFKSAESYVDLPGFARVIGDSIGPLVDGVDVPAGLRAEMDASIPARYIILLPIAPCEVVIEEVVAYPALAR